MNNLLNKITWGDSFELVKTIENQSVDLVLTDMPYDLDEDQKSILVEQSLRVSRGDVLIFCSPENQIKSPKYLFWVKPTSTKNFSKSHGRFVEMIALFQRGKTFNQLFWANMTGVYRDVLEGKPVHPYQKPMSLIERLINIHSNKGDIVLDLFAGSGTVCLGARNLGRNYIGIEQDLEYFTAATTRLYDNK